MSHSRELASLGALATGAVDFATINGTAVGWLAEACEAHGLVFLGPPASAMRALGDKIAAKRLAEKAGVPVSPWSRESVDEAGKNAVGVLCANGTRKNGEARTYGAGQLFEFVRAHQDAIQL